MYDDIRNLHSMRHANMEPGYDLFNIENKQHVDIGCFCFFSYSPKCTSIPYDFHLISFLVYYNKV